MDFRDNWLKHFRAVVDQEIEDADRDVVAGRTAVALNLEKGEQTIYQHYTQKSGKTYPTVEMMVLLEKKYGRGRPPGWAAAAPPEGDQAPSYSPIEFAIETLAECLAALDGDARVLIGDMLASLAKHPANHARVAAAISAATRKTPAEAKKPKQGEMSSPLKAANG